jgi:hypothetical protein
MASVESPIVYAENKCLVNSTLAGAATALGTDVSDPSTAWKATHHEELVLLDTPWLPYT